MPDLKDINNIYLIAAFIIPGLITTYVRAQFIAGRMEKLTDAALSYLTLTLIYYGFSIPIISGILSLPPSLPKTISWWLLIFAGPAAFGLLLGMAMQWGLWRWIARKLRLRVVHGTPTSWDWQFSNPSYSPGLGWRRFLG